MRANEFLIERAPSANVSNKLNFIKSKINAGEVTDPKTVDYIYKIIQKPEIQNAITAYLGPLEQRDPDVSAFQQRNNSMLANIIRKLPVEKEKLDKFVAQWSKGKGFVNTDLLQSGNKGTLQQLISDPTAFVAFETFEKLRSQVRLHKKGVAGYGEFGMAMLSPLVTLKAPGDIEVNGQPVEVKGNDARLYADERTAMEEARVKQQLGQQPIEEPGAVDAQKTIGRGSAPGALNNVLKGILLNDPNVIEQAIAAFEARGVNASKLIKTVQNQGEDGFETLATAWWRASFNAYHNAIKMPIMVIGFGQFLISDNADDFIQWGCLPRTPTNYGYMFGRKVGQTRETYPKIFVPGHNK